MSQDKTGQTRVGDLSAEDMKKVRRLVLIEMSALFDTCGIEVKAHKALKVKVRGQCLRYVFKTGSVNALRPLRSLYVLNISHTCMLHNKSTFMHHL